VRALALALLVAAGGAARGAPAEARRAPAPAGALERRREAIARELVAVAGALRREVERGDVAALVARVPDAGLRCRGRSIPKARVARDLAARGSWLHGVFFGGPGYAPAAGVAPSLAALFAARAEVAVVVTFQPDARAGAAGRPCVDFRAEGIGTPGAPICFEERGGRWWVTESLYPCGGPP
jgi:hypothetical protein